MNTALPIRDLRSRAHITQQALADRVGVSRVAICHYETGRRSIPVSLLPAIKDALGCTWEELFDDENSTADGG